MTDPRAALAVDAYINSEDAAGFVRYLAERGVRLVTEADERAITVICNYDHAFVFHTRKSVSECPMYQDHKRLFAAIFAALSGEATDQHPHG